MFSSRNIETLDVREHLLWKRLECPLEVSDMHLRPDNDDPFPPPSISTEQNRPIMGSIVGVVWNVYMSSVINAKEATHHYLDEAAMEAEEHGTEWARKRGRVWWGRWAPPGALVVFQEGYQHPLLFMVE